MKLSFKYSVEDWMEGYKTYALRGRRKWMTRFYVVFGGFFLLMSLVVALGSRNSLKDAAPLLLLGVLWIYVGTALWKRAGRRAFLGRPELQQEYSVTLEDSGVSFAGPLSICQWTWPAFVGCLESKTTFLLMLSPCAFAIFPKRIFGPGEMEQFRELVRQKLPAK